MKFSVTDNKKESLNRFKFISELLSYKKVIIVKANNILLIEFLLQMISRSKCFKRRVVV